MSRSALCLCLSLCSLFAPLRVFGQAQAVNQIQGPPPYSWVSLYFYNGSNQVTDICQAPSQVPVTTYSVGGTPAITNITVSGGTGTLNFAATAQVWVGQQVTVALSATTALNGTYKILTVSGTAATISTSAANATYTDMTVSTTNPLLNQNVWAIEVFQYSSGNVSGSYWAGSPSLGPSQNLACSNRSNY